MRGGTDDNDLWMKTFGMSHALLSLVYAQNNTACVAGVMSRKVAGKKILFFPSNSVRLLKGSSKEDKKNVRRCDHEVFDSFQCITCSQRLSDGSWATGATSAPKTCKRIGECGHDAVQVAVEGGKSCAVAPSKTTITWKKWILPGITMKNLLSMARGFAVHLHARVMSYVASGSEKRAVLL